MKKLLVRLFIFSGLVVGLISAVRHFDRLGPINLVTRTCLVTGASSGIGKHLAIEMVTRGWKVIGVARRTELLDQISKDLGTENFIPFVCDVSNLKDIHTISNNIKTLGLEPTLFFLNAGMGEPQPKWEFSTTNHQQTFATNYLGSIAWIEEWLLPVKKLGGGTFVTTSSIMALLATPGDGAYAASKIALIHCFDALRRQYLHDNIGFSVILPGPVNTELLKGISTKSLPFIHQPDQEARYIINQVFTGKKTIEPSWFYSTLFKLMSFCPDTIIVKMLGS